MTSPISLKRWIGAIINPIAEPAIDEQLERFTAESPVLWLLGKTGAGKSSIVQRLTRQNSDIVGNGFEPFTSTASLYEFPEDNPVVRFLDTRGLGEVGYDPSEDLVVCGDSSHALLIVVRVDDISQANLCDALASIVKASTSRQWLKKSSIADRAILIHTALHTRSGSELERSIAYNTEKIERSLGANIPQVRIDFTSDRYDTATSSRVPAKSEGLDELVSKIDSLLPDLQDFIQMRNEKNKERALFLLRRKEIMAYASACAAADVVPAFGLIAVPSVQGKMLHSLAARYDLDKDSRTTSEFIATLGSAFLYRYAITLMGRQLIKLVPVYGQTAGAAAAASISFSSTYALGRAACVYFYHRQHGESVSATQLQSVFKDALSISSGNN